MKSGNSPIGLDGLPINLHHVTGDEPGTMIELLTSTHARKGSNGKPGIAKAIHNIVPRGKSFRNNPKAEAAYDKFRGNYWKERAKGF